MKILLNLTPKTGDLKTQDCKIAGLQSLCDLPEFAIYLILHLSRKIIALFLDDFSEFPIKYPNVFD